jgi:hypothetical protein
VDLLNLLDFLVNLVEIVIDSGEELQQVSAFPGEDGQTLDDKRIQLTVIRIPLKLLDGRTEKETVNLADKVMEFLVGIEETDKMLLLQLIVFGILELAFHCGVQLIDTL